MEEKDSLKDKGVGIKNLLQDYKKKSIIKTVQKVYIWYIWLNETIPGMKGESEIHIVNS